MIDNISWLAIYPEILLLVMACVIALVDLGVKSPRRTGTYVLTLLTLGVVAVLQGMYASSGNTFYGWGNMVVSDAMGNWLKCFATVAMMVTLVYGRPYAADRDMLRGGELFTLAMLALLGMFITDEQVLVLVKNDSPRIPVISLHTMISASPSILLFSSSSESLTRITLTSP